MPLQEELRHTHFIYCLQQQEDGSYVFLNRNYKPVGFIDVGFLDYSQFPVAVHLKGLTAKLAEKLSVKGENTVQTIYLYDDGTTPTSSTTNMQAYLKRLEIVAKLKIDRTKHPQ